MDNITHEMRLQQWQEIISNCNASGMSKKAWCEQNGIGQKTFYYWQRRVRQEVYHQMNPLPSATKQPPVPVFAEIQSVAENTSMNRESPAVIRKGDIAIEISDNVSAGLLSRLMEALTYA